MKRLKGFAVGIGVLLTAVALFPALPVQSSDPMERIAALEAEVAELQQMVARDYFTHHRNFTLLFRDLASTNLAMCREAAEVDWNFAELFANSRAFREAARNQELICARIEADFEQKVEEHRQAQEDFERLMAERRN